MLKVHVNWRGTEATEAVRAAARTTLRRLAEFTRERLREAISTPYPPASRPGESPHLRTGALRDSLRVEADEVAFKARVAVGKYYGLLLERGTRRIMPRPWLEVTLRKILPALRGLAQRGGRV